MLLNFIEYIYFHVLFCHFVRDYLLQLNYFLADLDHICEDEIQEKLCRTIENCAPENQFNLLRIPYFQIKSREYTPSIRVSILKRVLGTILTSCDQQIIELFYKNFFEEDFNNLIESPYTSASRAWDLKQAYVDRTCCFHLITVNDIRYHIVIVLIQYNLRKNIIQQILVYLSDPSIFDDASNPILRSFPDFKQENPREVLSTLTRKAFKARTFMNYDENDTESAELFRS